MTGSDFPSPLKKNPRRKVEGTVRHGFWGSGSESVPSLSAAQSFLRTVVRNELKLLFSRLARICLTATTHWLCRGRAQAVVIRRPPLKKVDLRLSLGLDLGSRTKISSVDDLSENPAFEATLSSCAPWLAGWLV